MATSKKTKKDESFANARGTRTVETAKNASTRRRNMGFGKEGDTLYSASKDKGLKTSAYKGVNDGAPTDRGTVSNRKNIRTLMKQLDRIRANSDGSQGNQRLVERAERAVNAYAAYHSLGGVG